MGVLDQLGTLPEGTTVRDVVLPTTMFASEHEWAADPVARGLVRELDLDPKRYPPRGLSAQVSNLKNELVDAETLTERAAAGTPAELIRERPLASFGVAFAAGWIIAKLARSGGDK